MSKKHSRRVRRDDPMRVGKEAQQMIEMIDLFVGEVLALERLFEFTDTLLKQHYERHIKLRRVLLRCQSNQRNQLTKLQAVLREYRGFLADFEHKNGHVEAPSIQGLLNYSISIEDLLELFPYDTVVEDFLDG